MQVHIDRGGQRFGPYTIEQVNAHLADGSLLPSDLGWTDGMADWVPITQVSGVTTAEAATPPPPPAEPSAPPAIPGSTCPQCQAEVTADQVVCMSCGTNLQSGETPTFQTAAKPAGNKKLLIGIGASVGVLALAGVGYFVVYPKLSDDGSNQEPTDIVEGEPMVPVPGGPGFGPGMGQPPGGEFTGGQGGGPQGGFGGQGRPQGGIDPNTGLPGAGPQGGFGGQGRPQGGFGGQGRPQKGGGLMRFDKNKDGKISKAEVPEQMAGFFDRLDKNKDGFVNQNEMRSISGGFGSKGRPQGGGQQGGFGGKGRPQGGIDPSTGLPVGGGGLGGQGGRPQGGFGGKGRPQGGGQKGGKGRPLGGGAPNPPTGIPGQGQPQPR
tara:strand:- start:606 stop:1739 length:1134 start_codon:yes stop_codon:yes gene_type:complete